MLCHQSPITIRKSRLQNVSPRLHSFCCCGQELLWYLSFTSMSPSWLVLEDQEIFTINVLFSWIYWVLFIRHSLNQRHRSWLCVPIAFGQTVSTDSTVPSPLGTVCLELTNPSEGEVSSYPVRQKTPVFRVYLLYTCHSPPVSPDISLTHKLILINFLLLPWSKPASLQPSFLKTLRIYFYF